MANRRIINCDIFEDEWYGQLDFFDQQLWIGLFSRMADDQGRLLDNPILIGRYIFLYKSIDPEKVDKALAGFHNDGKIIRYENGGKKLIQIKRWWENQRPQWASPSNFDPPENWADKIRTRINGKYFVKNWGSAEDSHSSPEQAPERAPEDDKKDLSARHVPVPVPIPVPVVNASATANFFSKFQSIAGPLMGNTQVDQIADFLPHEEQKTKPPPIKTEELIQIHQSIVDLFVREFKFKRPKIPSGTWDIAWVEPIEEILAMVELDRDKAVELIREAVGVADKDKLTITTPKSLLSNIRSIHGRQQRQSSDVGTEFHVEDVLSG